MESPDPNFKPYTATRLTPAESLVQAQSFEQQFEQRRSVRDYADTPVDRAVVEAIVRTASSAPSGAHKQPWTFCIIGDPDVKQKIREAAEKEEYENYHGRMSEEWLEDLQAFGTDWHKPFLTTAPWLIVVFKKAFDYDEEGKKSKNYYVNESVGIACGFLLAAIHNAGLVSLTHTPSPMNFLQRLLERPDNERPFLLVPVGYPAPDAQVPVLHRKSLEQISKQY